MSSSIAHHINIILTHTFYYSLISVFGLHNFLYPQLAWIPKSNLLKMIKVILHIAKYHKLLWHAIIFFVNIIILCMAYDSHTLNIFFQSSTVVFISVIFSCKLKVVLKTNNWLNCFFFWKFKNICLQFIGPHQQ